MYLALGNDPFPPGKHPSLEVPGLLRCPRHPGWLRGKGGKRMRIADQVIILPSDPRAHAVEMAILLFFPLMVFNHTFDTLFRPEGSVMKTSQGPVIFAVPLDQKIVTQEMIDIAADFVRSGGLQKFIANAPKEASSILTDTMGAGLLGAKFGYWGAAIGAAIGAIKGLLTFGFGDQIYDVPDSLKPYVHRITAARTKRGIHYHYSTDDRDDACAIVLFDEKGDFTLPQAAERLLQKLGQAGPASAPARPAPKPAAPRRPVMQVAQSSAPAPLRRAPAPLRRAPAPLRRAPAPLRRAPAHPAAWLVIAGLVVGVAVLAARRD